MNDKKQKLTPSELRIMKALWQRNEQSLGEILEKVNFLANKSFSRSTINMQLIRLLKKGWIQQIKKGNRLFYSPTVAENDASYNIINDIKKRVFGGSCVDLVKSLLNNDEQISKEDVQQIKEMIENFKEK
ncbi:BlaI/MecI/CopY family transcriptional regulator [Lentisphaerota bacterium WC36G]|nr:BlaI/MecI/CopY family transcriptional regulator [Lentisphaerae bacterium WC36]